MEFPQFEFVWYFSDDWASGFGGWVGVDQRDKLPPVSSYQTCISTWSVTVDVDFNLLVSDMFLHCQVGYFPHFPHLCSLEESYNVYPTLKKWRHPCSSYQRAE